MIIVKRYSNRKLYDTQKKKYIVLNDIQNMLQSGFEIRVINNDTGEDITSKTMAEIIAGAERNQNGFLSQEFLSSLIRIGQNRVVGIRQAFHLSTIINRLVDQEISRRLVTLSEKGRISEAEQEHIRELLVASTAGDVMPSHVIDEYFQSLLQEAKIPSRLDFDRLQDELDQLNAQLDTYLQTTSSDETG